MPIILEILKVIISGAFHKFLGLQVWSESSDGSGVVNFLTGMGGFLQAVLFGYTGFRCVSKVTNTQTHTHIQDRNSWKR